MAAGDGLVSMAPTSIAYSGTSAGINADGGVDFSAVTSLSLNGVFTSAYDNYLIVLDGTGSAGGYLRFRLRASGTDNSTASSYVTQELYAASTTRSGARNTLDNGLLAYWEASTNSMTLSVYGPYLAQPTAFRSVTANGEGVGTSICDEAGTHNQSTAYDGFTIYPNSGNITGNIHVFGYEE
jgi:hypothetical protein